MDAWFRKVTDAHDELFGAPEGTDFSIERSQHAYGESAASGQVYCYFPLPTFSLRSGPTNSSTSAASSRSRSAPTAVSVRCRRATVRSRRCTKGFSRHYRSDLRLTGLAARRPIEAGHPFRLVESEGCGRRVPLLSVASIANPSAPSTGRMREEARSDSRALHAIE